MSHVSAFHITCNAGYELNLEARLNGNPTGQPLASKLVAGETIDVDLKDRAKKGDTVMRQFQLWANASGKEEKFRVGDYKYLYDPENEGKLNVVARGRVDEEEEGLQVAVAYEVK
ncbi:hypothetical protein CB0940_10922 [Cercospora beticola]|uniref:Uncharacterized protein n=1 Tax=Cercospora beticola TaxID=122368 RepID=A0A2G5HDZ5_CERBT|nr:hypothetical protein CB0940_10922 [Cercospora beticola]PIA90770.1 hypothetical protein CB0940_10922 [Cercospora beticola]WPB07737.1 hypothetical protein RHO25_012400 [Cercospora beticola]